MLIAKPAPEDKIRELAVATFRDHPGISLESFLLPRDESCNFQWNIISTNAFAPLLEWYASIVAKSEGLDAENPEPRQHLLEELLRDVLADPDHSVVVGERRVPLTVDYLMERENWISNATQIAIHKVLGPKLGSHFSDIDVVISREDPWLGAGRFVFASSLEGVGIIQKIASLRGGPRQVYRYGPVMTAFFNRTKLYEIVEDTPIERRRRRIAYKVYWTNHYYVVPEVVAANHLFFSYFPVLFAQHSILKRVPGFNLPLADVRFEFPEGDYSGTWEITIDYDITPIDRVRSWFNVGELQGTVATLSAEILELQRDRKALSEEAERLAGRLVKEEKARRVYQVRAAQADAVARFLHQTSNLVLQPLASMMTVFEDLVEIADDCRTEWMTDRSGEELLQELDDSLERVKDVYPSASRVMEGYRELFRAFYEVYVSTAPERDVNQDLRYIEELVRNKYILTHLEVDLELDPDIPSLRLEGGMQSIFLELMHNAAQHGAQKLLVRTAFDREAEEVHLYFYNDGEPIPEEQWVEALGHGIDREDKGSGLMDARYIVETLNGGRLRLESTDREGFNVLFSIHLQCSRMKT
jgi:hypothetical protein